MVLSLKRFEGKVAVITGASAGIGASIAEQLVKNGIIVAGLARRAEKVEALAKQLGSEKGKLHAFKCDMSKREDVESTIKKIIATLGPIHILVNNAGLSLYGSLITGNPENWKTVFETNVIGLCVATKEVVQNMKANNTQGHIIHINSVLGHIVMDFPGSDVYTASKHAVTALAETLRLELNREKLPIKVTSVSPGIVTTEFQAVAGIGDNITGLPALASDDVAEVVIYALSTAPNVNVSELTVRALNSI